MAFGVNMQRAEAFLGIFDKPGGVPRTKGQPSNNEKELLRATVVFAVAALDAYLHDLVLEEATRQGVRSDGLVEALRTIAKEDPSLALRVAMADSKADRHTEFRAALGSWLSTKSFQGPEAVFRALGYIGKLTSQDALNARIRVNWAQELRVWTEMPSPARSSRWEGICQAREGRALCPVDLAHRSGSREYRRWSGLKSGTSSELWSSRKAGWAHLAAPARHLCYLTEGPRGPTTTSRSEGYSMSNPAPT
jgi:hypothetical protein